MKEITNISQLNKGDKIWRIQNDTHIEIIEFLCIHPYCPEYSLFIDSSKDGMPKFYNKRLETSKWYLYDKDSKKNIALERIKTLEVRLKNLKIIYSQEYE